MENTKQKHSNDWFINDNFTVDEIRNSNRELKNNKSAGQDHIPAEFVRICSEDLVDVIALTFHYMIEQREFPGPWALGQRTPVFKNGCKSNADNYRGITILSIFAKIFEITVNKRLTFVSEAFSVTDKFNGGFLRGSRTSDNIFIIQGLLQGQLALRKPLFIRFVDFSKAFDLVNRSLWFSN